MTPGTKGPKNSTAADGRASADPELARRTEPELARPISALSLPARAENALVRNGVRTIGQLLTRSRDGLVTEIIGLGTGSLAAIEDALARENLALATENRSFRYKRPYAHPNDRHARNHNTWLTPGQ